MFKFYCIFFLICATIFIYFYIYVTCMTLMKYAGFLLISKLDHKIKFKKLIYSVLIQYFETN